MALTRAMDAVPDMPAPGSQNIPALLRLTWQALAMTCVTGDTLDSVPSGTVPTP